MLHIDSKITFIKVCPLTVFSFNILYFQIEIEDVNEAPIGIGIYGGGILKENSAEGTIIGDINTRDQEKNQIYTYTLDAIYPGYDICLVHTVKPCYIKHNETLMDVFFYIGSLGSNGHLEYLHQLLKQLFFCFQIV